MPKQTVNAIPNPHPNLSLTAVRACSVSDIAEHLQTSTSQDLTVLYRAEEFDVTLPFLLQQAAWLYERQLSQVREQLRKVNQTTSSRASPAPISASGSTTVGDHAMRRVGSGGMALINLMSPLPKLRIAGSRVPSSLSTRARDSPNLQSGGSSTPVPARGDIVRNIQATLV